MLEKIKKFLFENTTTRQTVAKNTFWLTIGTVGSRTIKAVIIIVAARILGTSEYGLFSYALSLAGFFTVFADIGITGILVRESVKNPELREKYLSTSFYIKIVLVLFTAAATVALAPFYSRLEGASALLPLVAILLAFDSMRDFSYAVIRAENKMELEAFISLGTNIAIVLCSLIALAVSPNSMSLTIGYVAGVAAGSIGAYIVLLPRIRGILSHFKKSLVKPILAAAWPLGIASFMGSIMLNTDQIMLGWYRSAQEIGLYAAAQRPIQFVYMFPGLIATSLFPVFSRFAKEGSEAKSKNIMEKSMAITFLLSLPLTVGGILTAAPLIFRLFGSEYIPAVFAFQLLLATVITNFPLPILYNFAFAHEKQRVFLVSTTLGAVGNLIFNLLLIPRWGIPGSAIATLLAQLLCTSYLWINAKKIAPFSVAKNIWRPVLASAVMGFVVWVLMGYGTNIAITISCGAIAYFVILLALKEPLWKEIRAIASPQ